MGRHSSWVIALALATAAVTIAAAVAVAEKPTIVRAGNLVLTINGGVRPKALSKHELTPIAFHGSGDLATVDGSHPPAFKESVFDVDKDAAIDVSGLPVCRKSQLENRGTADAKRACPTAILGAGSATVEVAFPDQPPIRSTGPLVLFNGGEKGGVSTFFVHGYVAIPVPTAIVVTVTATREANGPYGLRIVARDPLIAGGSGSPTHFDIHTYRFVKDKDGHRRGFLFARCSDGRLQGKGSATFRDGTTLFGGIARACQAAG